MTAALHQLIPDGAVVPVEQLRAYLLGPTVARLLREDQLNGTHLVPHYSITVGGPLALEPEHLYCPICGGGFPIVATFAYACSKTSEVWREDKRVGQELLVLHSVCLRFAQETGQPMEAVFDTRRGETNG